MNITIWLKNHKIKQGAYKVKMPGQWAASPFICNRFYNGTT